MIASCTQFKGQPLGYQVAQERIFSLVAKEMGHITERLGIVVKFHVRKDPDHVQFIDIFDGYEPDKLPHALSWIRGWAPEIRDLDVLVHNRGESLCDPCLQFIDFMPGVNGQSHDV